MTTQNSRPGETSQRTESHTNWTRDIEPAKEQGEALQRLVVSSLGRLTRHVDFKWKAVLGSIVDDVIQSFAVKMLEGKVVANADRKRGRFRAYLLKCFDHHVIDWLRKSGTRSSDEAVADDNPPTSSPVDVDPFDAIWAEELFRLSCEQLQRRCFARDATDIWNVANDQFVQPVLRATSPLTYEQLAERYGFSSPNAAGGKLRTARKWFEQCTRAIIERFATGPDDVELELHDYIQALSCLGHSPRPNEPGVAYLYTDIETDLEGYCADAWSSFAQLATSAMPRIVTFDDLFHHPSPPPDLLTLVKDYAKAEFEHGHDVPKDVAGVMYYACIAVARRAGLPQVSMLDDASFRTGIDWCLGRRWLDERTRKLLIDSQETGSHA